MKYVKQLYRGHTDTNTGGSIILLTVVRASQNKPVCRQGPCGL